MVISLTAMAMVIGSMEDAWRGLSEPVPSIRFSFDLHLEVDSDDYPPIFCFVQEAFFRPVSFY